MIKMNEDVAIRIFWSFFFFGTILGIRWIMMEVGD